MVIECRWHGDVNNTALFEKVTAGWQEARAAKHSFRHSSARISLASSAARRSAAAASSRSRACSTLMLAWAAFAASAVSRASRSSAAVLSLSCGPVHTSQAFTPLSEGRVDGPSHWAAPSTEYMLSLVHRASDPRYSPGARDYGWYPERPSTAATTQQQ